MMPATKLIHLNPNGNIIKINGNIYRHYTRNLTVSLPSIFYAISHGATVHEVLSSGDTVKLTTQNYALDNEKAHWERLEKEQNEMNMAQNTANVENNDFMQNELPESIESDTLTSDLNDNFEDEEKSNKKNTKKSNSKKATEE